MADYGAALLRARVKASLSQRQLGEAVGVNRAHIAMIETGRISEPSPELQQKIAAALGGEPEPIAPAGETGPRAELMRMAGSLSDEEAQTVLGLIDVLQRHGWGRGKAGPQTD